MFGKFCSNLFFSSQEFSPTRLFVLRIWWILSFYQKISEQVLKFPKTIFNPRNSLGLVKNVILIIHSHFLEIFLYFIGKSVNIFVEILWKSAKISVNSRKTRENLMKIKKEKNWTQTNR